MKFEDYIKKNIYINNFDYSKLFYIYINLFKNNPYIKIDFFYKTDYTQGEYFIVYKYTENIYGNLFTRYFFVYDIFYEDNYKIKLNKNDIIDSIKLIKSKNDLLKELDSSSDNELVILLNNYVN